MFLKIMLNFAPDFPQFAMIHTVKGFGIVNKTEGDVFLELFCFFDDPTDAGNLISSIFYNVIYTTLIYC